MQLTDDARVILLLCGRFSEKSSRVKPLNIRDYNKLARWLIDQKLRPGALLDESNRKRLFDDTPGLDVERIASLLGRGAAMALSVEQWSNKGIWVLCRSDAAYPKRFRDHLRECAPAIIYGVGDQSLLNAGGVAVVGSRDIDAEAEFYTREFGEFCGREGISVISGGARGVDTTAMLASLNVGGMAVGILACDLIKNAVSGRYRQALMEKRLVLVSPYIPSARFNVGNAMGRNKHIYSLADHALVVNSGLTGGTWTGAVEELKRDNAIPVFVRMEGLLGEGNAKLVKQGARVMPERPWTGTLADVLHGNSPAEAKSEEVSKETSDPTPLSKDETDIAWADIFYRTFTELLSTLLKEDKQKAEIAETLVITTPQAYIWLERAAKDKLIKKLSRPARYIYDDKTQEEFGLQ
jgi:predicted Rossmann fold nucleotide-binding protein DprA/Smf involved in DNA uptake